MAQAERPVPQVERRAERNGAMANEPGLIYQRTMG